MAFTEFCSWCESTECVCSADDEVREVHFRRKREVREAKEEALRQEGALRERAAIVAVLLAMAQSAASWGDEERCRTLKDAAKRVERGERVKVSP